MQINLKQQHHRSRDGYTGKNTLQAGPCDRHSAIAVFHSRIRLIFSSKILFNNIIYFNKMQPIMPANCRRIQKAAMVNPIAASSA